MSDGKVNPALQGILKAPKKSVDFVEQLRDTHLEDPSGESSPTLTGEEISSTDSDATDDTFISSGELVARPGTTKKSSSAMLLDRVMTNLAHLNLSQQVFVKTTSIMSNHGGAADVFEGYQKMPETGELVRVAVKRLRLIISDEQLAKDIAKEIRIWSELDHPNILKLRGYFVEGKYPSLVSQWMEKGSLWEYKEKLSSIKALSMILGVAQGLTYLHGRGATHSDVKSDNVLVSPDERALLTDFGISRMDTLSKGYTSQSSKGSTRWQAKEFFAWSKGAPPPQHTYKTDVWAFGMTIYELLAKNRPYSSYKNNWHVILAIKDGDLPEEPTISDESDNTTIQVERYMWSLCKQCWEADPENRPSMSEIEIDVRREYEQY